MKYALLFVLVTLLAACGGDPYKAPPSGNGTSAGNTSQPPVPKTQPTGPDQDAEYTKAAKAAFAARDAYRNDKTADNFAIWGAHTYDAVRFKILQTNYKRSTAKFYKLKELSEMFTDFKKTIGPAGWEDNADYKAAKKAYDEVQQTQ
jgi:hypothetical protein